MDSTKYFVGLDPENVVNLSFDDGTSLRYSLDSTFVGLTQDVLSRAPEGSRIVSAELVKNGKRTDLTDVMVSHFTGFFPF